MSGWYLKFEQSHEGHHGVPTALDSSVVEALMPLTCREARQAQ